MEGRGGRGREVWGGVEEDCKTRALLNKNEEELSVHVCFSVSADFIG